MSSTDEIAETKATMDAGESERVRKEGGEEGDALMNIKLKRKRELSGSEVMMRGEQDKVVGFNEMRQTSMCVSLYLLQVRSQTHSTSKARAFLCGWPPRLQKAD